MGEAPGRSWLRAVTSRQMVLATWVPALLITILHYATNPAYAAFHDVLRRLYYLPILFAAFAEGLTGGLTASLGISLAYAPHAFMDMTNIDPARPMEKMLEVLLYFLVGAVAGVLVDREKRRGRELAATTEQLRQALGEKESTQNQLIRAGRLAALGEMVAGIAHEIKNPLHALKGSAEVVDTVVPHDTPQRRLWELHQKELDRLSNVAERFLSFARPSPPRRRDVDLAALIERTRSLVSMQARQQRVGIAVHPPPPGAPSTIQGDPEQLIQVFLNVSLNALQAMDKIGDALEVSFSPELRGARRYVAVLVANNGPAIPAEDLERIFDPFFTTKPDGSGLGLSVATRIVEQHGGLIEVANTGASRGVTFRICLPA